MASLRFSTDILRRLGEELNPNPDQGILELVKNAHDADATECLVRLYEEPTNDLTIEIIDDGLGMTKRQIEDGWLVLGSSHKEQDGFTPRGRKFAGSKGLGRLAALRLGRKARVVTRASEDPSVENSVELDWEKFDAVNIVEDVAIAIESKKLGGRDLKPGTSVTISGIKAKVSRWEMRRMARGLILLADPFQEHANGFIPRLEAPEFEDLEALVRRRYFEDAEFHLSARVDSSGFLQAEVRDYKGNVLYKGEHADIRTKSPTSPFDCPPFQFDLWAFILTKSTFEARTSSVAEVREWLAEFGGVHFYLHGLRLSPYGDKGNDWLAMNLSRVRNPELRPGTNTAIGRITVSEDGGRLAQKTDRGGLVESAAFEDLKEAAVAAMDWLARRRLAERERRRRRERAEAKRQEQDAPSEQDPLKGIPQKDRNRIATHFAQELKKKDRVIRVLHKDVQLYRTMSTAGIEASTFAHEVPQPLQDIESNTKLLRTRTRKHVDQADQGKFLGPLDRIDGDIGFLNAFANITLDTIESDKRRVGRVDVHPTIINRLEALRPVATDRNIEIVANLVDGHPYLRTTEASIDLIVTNLVVNSIKALEENMRKSIIEIRTTREDDELILQCLDTGEGIHGIALKDIWLPGESGRVGGTGLGLAIVHDTVSDLGGGVEAEENGERGGATLTCRIPMDGW